MIIWSINAGIHQTTKLNPYDYQYDNECSGSELTITHRFPFNSLDTRLRINNHVLRASRCSLLTSV